MIQPTIQEVVHWSCIHNTHIEYHGTNHIWLEYILPYCIYTRRYQALAAIRPMNLSQPDTQYTYTYTGTRCSQPYRVGSMADTYMHIIYPSGRYS
jgi:hypothetical protein